VTVTPGYALDNRFHDRLKCAAFTKEHRRSDHFPVGVGCLESGVEGRADKCVDFL